MSTSILTQNPTPAKGQIPPQTIAQIAAHSGLDPAIVERWLTRLQASLESAAEHDVFDRWLPIFAAGLAGDPRATEVGR